MERRYYIAYGSNLNVTQMKTRCPSARIIGTSVIKDYELLFKGSKTGSYLTIEKKKGAKVPVAIWETQESDERALDRYEGCPQFYYKTEMILPIKGIKSKKVRIRKAYVYIMHEDRELGTPSKFYLGTCLEGYLRFGFDPYYLVEAINRSRRIENEEGR
jgi:hypothetical protein